MDQNQSNPWKHLSTISTFDTGSDSRVTTLLEEARDEPTGGHIIGRVSPSTSLLIESLVKSACATIESDPTRRDKLYLILCEKLHEMRFLDGSYNMMEFESIRGQYQQAWYRLVQVARAAAGTESIIEIPDLSPDRSRYADEFDEKEFIASGGFGTVFRAIHRLDGHEYAIKKIIVKWGRVKNILQQLEEVKTLAKLNHTNIVAYKCAWMERDLPPSCTRKTRVPNSKSSIVSVTNEESQSQSEETQSQSEESQSQSEEIHQSETSSSHVDRTGGVEENTDGPNSDVVSFRYEDGEEGDVQDVQDFTVSSDSSDIEEIPSPNHTSEIDRVSDHRVCPYSAPYSQRSEYATIYIQMALCDRTLRAWLDDRLEATPESLATTILEQILKGLHYMHSRDIVHHDIKPSNIFISDVGECVEIQVGDFGLACPRQRQGHDPVFGTELYAAPEQLNGDCDPKSDLYSLGIVLFEIFFPMATGMERHSRITKLKNGQMPEDFVEKYPKWADIIKKLLHSDPEKRLSASDLLESLNDKDSVISDLTNSNKEKDLIIQNLTLENQQLNHKISELLAALNTHQSS